MRIGLLNLPLDNNYGGNLQRYALVKILQSMGHEVEHIFLVRTFKLAWYKYPYSYTKRFVLKYVFRKKISIYYERMAKEQSRILERYARSFHERYIPSTIEIYDVKQLKSICQDRGYQCIVVGSDQVWRKSMTKSIGLCNFFLEFVNDENIKKVAYSVSLGSDMCDYKKGELDALGEMYKQFNAVSVREYSSLALFEQQGWIRPEAKWTLDPTMLLSKTDYEKLISQSDTMDLTTGKIFYYILDLSENLLKRIEGEDENHCVVVSLNDSAHVSIEQWLNNILKSDKVITDSFHGVVFSIIFNKPFVFVGNERRGNARICSLLKMLNIDMVKSSGINWIETNNQISRLKKQSMDFLYETLNGTRLL